MKINSKIITLNLSAVILTIIGIYLYIIITEEVTIKLPLLVFSIIMILINTLIVFYAARQITLGIKNLKDAAGDIYQGRLDNEVINQRNDETFEITQIINYIRLALIECKTQMTQNNNSLQITNQRMLNEIVERKRVENELIKHKYHLEELVKERTKELEETNEKLKQEVTERRLAQERQAQMLIDLEATNQELNDFAYIISHDLKAPLRSIGSLADWILNDYSDKLDQEGKDYMNLLVRRVRRMHSLIESLLGYSVLGRFINKMVMTDILQTVKDVIVELSPPPNIKITITDNLPILMFEKDLMRQVFYHLIGNAIRFIDKEPVGDSHKKGEIKITCSEEHNIWKFGVEDNGIGIEEKYFEKIFQIFQTLTPRDELENNGIGLTIVKKIIEMYGGSIWVKSTPKIGSTFFFTLPKNIGQLGY